MAHVESGGFTRVVAYWRTRLAKAPAALGRAGKHLWRSLRVLVFAALGLALVALAALFISIIQFQIRIIEAKNQSRNFSLTSLTQSVSMQKEFVESVKKVQENEVLIAMLVERRQIFAADTFRVVNLLCHDIGELQARQSCVTSIAGALSSTHPPNVVHRVIAQVTKIDVNQSSSTLKPLVDEALAIARARDEFNRQNAKNMSELKSACSVIDRYFVAAVEYSSVGIDKSSFIQSFSPEYVTVARTRCSFNWELGAPQNAKDAPKIGGASNGESQRNASKSGLESELAGALFFDLVAYFRFYESMFQGFCQVVMMASTCRPNFGGDVTETIVIAPIDISFVLLVIFCGALGAMLRIAAEQYNPRLFGKERSEVRSTSWVYYFIIGTMCSLIVYILAKTVFAGLADTTYAAKSGNMSPFVIAFMAIVSGLLCEEAFQQIVRAGKATLARSTGGDAAQRGRNAELKRDR